MPSIVVTSDDAGAPALSNSPGSLQLILEWVLPQLGWVVVFSDHATYKTAFQNAGSGAFFQVTDDGAGGLNAIAQITAYSSMTALDTGAHQTSSVWWAKDNKDADGPKKWWFIGDGSSFLYIPSAAGGTGTEQHVSQFYCGDYADPASSLDSVPFLIHGCSSATEYFISYPGTFTTNSYNAIYTPVGPDGTDNYRLYTPSILNRNNIGTRDGMGAYGPYSWNGEVLLYPVLLGHSTSSSFYIGRLRGVYGPTNLNHIGVYNTGDIASLETPDGLQNVMVFRTDPEFFYGSNRYDGMLYVAMDVFQ